MEDEGFPLIAGLTQTAADDAPLYDRLLDALQRRSGGASAHLADAMTALEQAHAQEANPEMLAHIRAVQDFLAGCEDTYKESAA